MGVITTWMRPPVVAAFVLVVMAARQAPAQTGAAVAGPPATRAIRGTVVDSLSDTPLRNVRIVAMAGGTRVASVLTDGDGAFSMSTPQDRALTFRLTKARYAEMSVPLSEDRRRDLPIEMRLSMARAAAITVQVRDASGVPIAGCLVPVTLRRVAANGAMTEVSGPVAVPGNCGNREGEYRFGGLAAGQYSVGPRFTPSAEGGLKVSTTIVDVAAGQERSVALGVEGRLPVRADVVAVERGGVVTVTNGTRPPAWPHQSGSGVIRGRVSTRAGELVPGATVIAISGQAWTTETDASGRFTLTGLPALTFTLSTSKRGYTDLGLAAPRPAVVLAEGEERNDIGLVVAQMGTISGTVVDEYGDPVQDASVRITLVTQDAQGVTTRAASGMFAMTATDDRGQFHLADVQPGTYVLAASMDAMADTDQRREAYTPTYYAGTPHLASAARLDVGFGSHISDLVVGIRPVPVARISGIALNSVSEPIAGTVRLIPRDGGPGVLAPRTTQSGAGGDFAFAGVPGGDYVVEIFVTGGAAGRERAAQAITVTDIDPAPLTLHTSPGAVLNGRLVLEGPSGRQLWGYSMLARRVDAALSTGFSATRSGPYPDGTTFTLRDLWGPTRVQFSSPDESWFLKSILINGVDAVDTPFDFGTEGRTFDDVQAIFAANPASIGGRVVDARGARVNEYVAVVFAIDADRWFDGSRWLKAVKPGGDGEFLVKGLPPGEYYVAAIDRLDGPSTGGAWQTVDFLHGLISDASRVSVGPGAASTTTLRVTRR